MASSEQICGLLLSAWETFQDPDTFEEHNTEENKKYNIFS